MAKKIEKMHKLFGVTEGKKCKDCMHLIGGKNEYRKCLCFGQSNASSTDWALSYDACGLWNKPLMTEDGLKIDIPVVRLQDRETEDEQIEGQMQFEDIEIWRDYFR